MFRLDRTPIDNPSLRLCSDLRTCSWGLQPSGCHSNLQAQTAHPAPVQAPSHSPCSQAPCPGPSSPSPVQAPAPAQATWMIWYLHHVLKNLISTKYILIVYCELCITYTHFIVCVVLDVANCIYPGTPHYFQPYHCVTACAVATAHIRVSQFMTAAMVRAPYIRAPIYIYIYIHAPFPCIGM